MNLANALGKEANKTTTTNGMKAFKSTTDVIVDLFYKIGGSRGKNILPEFTAALASDMDAAVRVALWARDVREGAGERQLFRDILLYLAQNDYKTAIRLLPKVPELGRWDDLLVLVDTPVWKEAAALIDKGLRSENGLCAKWMPRKGEVAAKLRVELGLTPKQYRKTLVHLTNVVETAMCAKEFSRIDYSKLPSLASARYQKAFGRNDNERYVAYLNSLIKGETKINAGAVYPYDVIKSLKYGKAAMANEQWKALPNFVADGIDFLPVVDVSGSMGTAVSGKGATAVTAMDVAISLGLYLSERCSSQFKDTFVTFSESPQLLKMSGNLETRYNSMRSSKWGMNTDLESVFNLVIDVATRFKLQQKDLPDYVIILSDMQFDAATVKNAGYSYGNVKTDEAKNVTAQKMIKQKFKAIGLEAPTIVYWNLNGKDNVPVKATAEGAILVSGFSPAIMKSLLGGKNVTPREVVMETIGRERYNW